MATDYQDNCYDRLVASILVIVLEKRQTSREAGAQSYGPLPRGRGDRAVEKGLLVRPSYCSYAINFILVHMTT